MLRQQEHGAGLWLTTAFETTTSLPRLINHGKAAQNALAQMLKMLSFAQSHWHKKMLILLNNLPYVQSKTEISKSFPLMFGIQNPQSFTISFSLILVAYESRNINMKSYASSAVGCLLHEQNA